MHALVDSDTICYRAGFGANKEGLEQQACELAYNAVQDIVKQTGADSYHLYLTGSRNFRYDIYPEYKGNRAGMKRPIHLQAIREFLVSDLGATVSDNTEADDEVGIAAYAAEDEVVIVHVDKDLDMLAGQHYNPVKKEHYVKTNVEAMRHFFWQLIMGDRADNIPGFDGLMRNKVPKFLYTTMEALDSLYTAEMMLDFVANNLWGCRDQLIHEDKEERWNQFNMAAQCLWIQRRRDDDWRLWMNDNTMGELGLPVGLIRSLHPPYGLQVDDGLSNTNA